MHICVITYTCEVVVGPGTQLCRLLEVWVLGVGMTTLAAQPDVRRVSGVPSTDDPGHGPVTSSDKSAPGPDPRIRYKIQIGMFRPIRVDHTNCLQVTIKTHSFIVATSSFNIVFQTCLLAFCQRFLDPICLFVPILHVSPDKGTQTPFTRFIYNNKLVFCWGNSLVCWFFLFFDSTTTKKFNTRTLRSTGESLHRTPLPGDTVATLLPLHVNPRYLRLLT